MDWIFWYETLARDRERFVVPQEENLYFLSNINPASTCFSRCLREFSWKRGQDEKGGESGIDVEITSREKGKGEKNMKKLVAVLCAVLVLSLFGVADAKAGDATPAWIQNLPQAQAAEQIFVVAGVGKTTAWISFHEKDLQGNWREIMTSPGFIGKEGLGKEREGDNKSPVGTFRFTEAFGIAPDPGCAIPYIQVDENYYWSGDGRPGMNYNKMVDIRKLPGLDTEASEHIVDYDPHYTYVMNISYNEACTPGLGSAIFLHCFGPFKPYTGGCVSLPTEKLRAVMLKVRPDCVVVIDSLRNLSPETAAAWNI